jgi:hypothetical protein
MKKKILFISFGVIVLLLIIAGFIFPLIPVGLIIPISENREQARVDKAIANSDFNLCDEVSYGGPGLLGSGKYFRKDCYAGVIKKIGDPKICESESVQKMITLDSCYRILSLQINNESLCPLLKEKDDGTGNLTVSNCYSNIATQKNDISLCSLLKEEDENQLYAKGMCYAPFAIKNQNPKICEAVANSIAQEACLNSYIFTIKPTLADCNNYLKDPDNRYYCYERVAARTKDPAICELIPEKTNPNKNGSKESCLIEANDTIEYH